MADTDIPKFKTYAEGEPIPAVDPEDIKRIWEYKRTHTQLGANSCQWRQGLQAAISPDADLSDVSSRRRMIDTLIIYKLLAPWQHGEDLHEAVFRIAATFPLRYLEHKSYMIPGDEHFGFDPNAFVQRLVDETGIAHAWERVPTKVPEGGRCIVTSRFTSRVQKPGEFFQNTERKAKSQARQILWEIWKRFSPSLDEVIFQSDKEHAAEAVAHFYANFLLDNIDLVRQLEDACRDLQHISLDPVLSELERKAQSWGG